MANIATQKRRYSRKGCLQCKARKLKCDETKPSCLYCYKSKRICDYSRIAKFSDDRTFTIDKNELGKRKRHGRGMIEVNGEPQVMKQLTFREEIYEPKNIDQTQTNARMANAPLEARVEALPGEQSNISSPIRYETYRNLPIIDDYIAPSEVAFGKQPFHRVFGENNNNYEDLFMDDVTSLIDGLNGITTIGAFDDVPKEDDLSANKTTPPHQLNEDYEDKIVKLIASYEFCPDHKNYLKLFNEKYSTWIFPFASGKKNVCYNTLMGQAVEFPFLLNAIISVVARYENFCQANFTDEYYQRYYFVKCCRGFAKIFENKSQVVQYIEPLILTTLLLVTDSVAFSGGDWRAHLRAAHNLFVKYVDIYKRKTNSILLSTFWFATFEILAVVSNPFGGSLTVQEDFDIMMEAGIASEDNRSSIEHGLVLPSGYNLFLGYSAEAITMFTTFAKIILPIKQRRASVVSTDDLRLLFSKIHEAGNYYLASRDCLIARNNPYHPNNQTGMLLPIATYGYTNGHVFSWFDISHKVHVDALHLKILVDKHFLNLPESSPMVEALTNDIMTCCHFFLDIDFEKENFNITEELEKCRGIPLWLDRRLLTVHWPLLTCGLYCSDKIIRLKIKFYFRCLIGMGARTLERSFEKLESKWNGGSADFDYVPFV